MLVLQEISGSGQQTQQDYSESEHVAFFAAAALRRRVVPDRATAELLQFGVMHGPGRHIFNVGCLSAPREELSAKLKILRQNAPRKTEIEDTDSKVFVDGHVF